MEIKLTAAPRFRTTLPHAPTPALSPLYFLPRPVSFLYIFLYTFMFSPSPLRAATDFVIWVMDGTPLPPPAAAGTEPITQPTTDVFLPAAQRKPQCYYTLLLYYYAMYIRKYTVQKKARWFV